MQPSRAVALARDVIAVARERGLTVTAAGLAYYAFNTLVPLVILAIVGASIVDAFDVVFTALEWATGLEAENTRGVIDDAIGEGGGRGRAAVLAIVILLWSAVRTFRAVNRAFTDIYGSGANGAPLSVAADVLLTVATFAVALVLVATVGISLSFTIDGFAWMVLSPFLLAALLFGAFLPMYYLFSGPVTSIREVVPGTAFAAVTWAFSALFFRLYAVTSESVALFGIAGGLLLLLTWMYVGGLLVLLGATVNAVLADRVEAEPEWVPLRDRIGQHA